MEERMRDPLGMLPSTMWEAAHLANQCAQKLAQQETFKAFQLWKEEKIKWMSSRTLEKFHSLNKLGLLMARIAVRAYPSMYREEVPLEAASREANKAAWASPMAASTVERRLVAAAIIQSWGSERTTAATAKFCLIAKSKLALILPIGGGAQIGDGGRCLPSWLMSSEGNRDLLDRIADHGLLSLMDDLVPRKPDMIHNHSSIDLEAPGICDRNRQDSMILVNGLDPMSFFL